MLGGCECAPLSTTATTATASTIIPLTCDTLCRLNNSRDGKDCAVWSDTQACESSYMNMGDAPFACMWLARDASCFADPAEQ
eukprot:3185873-Amphidinium_carterae.1